MKRKALLAVLFVGAVVVQASQASAKGINYAHFSGPGLHPDGVTIIRGDLQQTGLLKLKRNALAALGLSRRELGPAYRAEYRMDYAPRAPLRQVSSTRRAGRSRSRPEASTSARITSPLGVVGLPPSRACSPT